MASLSLKAAFGRARRTDLDRVHELVARTSQFNTTTQRRSRAELVDFLEAPGRAVYVASLSDKFGELGMVGVVLVIRKETELVFDSVIMSCRAMGFGLETVLLRAVIDAGPPATARSRSLLANRAQSPVRRPVRRSRVRAGGRHGMVP